MLFLVLCCLAVFVVVVVVFTELIFRAHLFIHDSPLPLHSKFHFMFGEYALFVIQTDTPSFAISRTPGFGYPLREGIEVSLKCDVDSNPRSTPIWQKDDGDPPVI